MFKTRFFSLLPAALLSIILLPGCAYLQPPDDPNQARLVQSAGDLAVKYATAKVIQESGNPSRTAERIIAVASLVSSDNEVVLETLVKVVHMEIDYEQLSPTNKVLVDELLDAILYELKSQKDERLPEQYQTQVRRIADLVIGVAEQSA